MDVTFASPLGVLVALLVVLPLTAIRLRERRAGEVRRALGLEPPARGAHRAAVLALVTAFGLLALAATQPLLRMHDETRTRADAEAYVILDTSRSMTAAAAARGPTRFERAVDGALALRAALPEVPFGAASLTDRLLPHLFPTGDASTFAAVVRRAVGIERPPPREQNTRATAYAALELLARDNFFSGRSSRRLAVLLTDGESRPFDENAVAGRLRRAGIGLLVVRYWSADERVFGPDGSVDPAYRPDSRGDPALARLAAMSGGRVYGEGELTSVAAAARSWVGDGPLVDAVEAARVEPLAPWVVLAAALPLCFVLFGVSPALRRRAPVRSPAPPAVPPARTDSPRSA
jgi:hypothetical protein